MKIINEKCNQKHEILIFLIFLSLIMKFSEGSEVFVSVAQAQSHSKERATIQKPFVIKDHLLSVEKAKSLSDKDFLLYFGLIVQWSYEIEKVQNFFRNEPVPKINSQLFFHEKYDRDPNNFWPILWENKAYAVPVDCHLEKQSIAGKSCMVGGYVSQITEQTEQGRTYMKCKKPPESYRCSDKKYFACRTYSIEDVLIKSTSFDSAKIKMSKVLCVLNGSDREIAERCSQALYKWTQSLMNALFQTGELKIINNRSFVNNQLVMYDHYEDLLKVFNDNQCLQDEINHCQKGSGDSVLINGTQWTYDPQTNTSRGTRAGVWGYVIIPGRPKGGTLSGGKDTEASPQQSFCKKINQIEENLKQAWNALPEPIKRSVLYLNNSQTQYYNQQQQNKGRATQ